MPHSARAASALFGVQKIQGRADAAIATGRRAVRLNPFDLDILADVGAYLIKQGRTGEGTELFEAALLLNASPPEWSAGVRALVALMNNDEAALFDAVGRSPGMGYALNGLMHVVAHSRRGQFAAADRFHDELMRRYPELEGNVRDGLRRLTLCDPVIDRLMPEVGWFKIQ